MLSRATYIAFALVFALTAVTVHFLLNRPALHVPKLDLKASKKETAYPTKQMRSGVQKDLWVTENGVRLHHQMSSPRSILTAYPKGDNFELVEEMQGMRCYLQEMLPEENRQQIRLIKSSAGTYSYSTFHFDAHQVFLALFELPGNELQTHFNLDDAFLKGVAEEVTLKFAESSPNFNAKKFKAQIRPKQDE